MRWIVLVVGLLAIVAAPSALGQDADHEITIEAPSECSDTTFCFEVVDGDLDAVEAGDTVEATFVNANGAEHDLWVASLEDADVAGDTGDDVALAGSDRIGEGEEATVTFTAPEGDGFYFWCDVPGHEQSGMYIEASSEGAGANGAPLPGVLALLAVLGAVAITRRPS